MSVRATEVFHHLMQQGRISANAEGFGIDIQYAQEDRVIYMATAVFQGDNYLPKSVRSAITGDALVACDEFVSARLVVDEKKHSVVLIYSLPLAPEDEKGFDVAVSDFIELAIEWRNILDEYGQQDLIHVPI